MSALTTERLASGRGPAGEVIAGLANDGSALTVARAAVEEAMSRHCGVRFVQVVSPGRTLVDRSRRATVLVVGDDASGTDGSVASYCQEHAACAVQVVPTV